jgi:DNA topoisomerase-1
VKSPNDESSQPDPTESARIAGLRHVSDAGAGIRRVRRGRGFSYIGPEDDPIREEDALARIRALAIPPAWTDVWICPSPRGHIQATGRDAKGRKQYRYHPRWRAVRDDTKYSRLIDFAEALPHIRARTSADLTGAGLNRDNVLAVVVQLLEVTLIRVGNEEYARQNRSFGLTTLRSRHVDIDGASICFEFRGKGGKMHSVDVRDRRLASVVRRLRDLPGQDLFQYVNGDGERRSITSGDVNDYLRRISGQDFTAKDFRTWAGTVLAAQALAAIGESDSDAEGKQNVVTAIESVAAQLGNTPAVCRKCYVHPEVIDAYLDGVTLAAAARGDHASPTTSASSLEPLEDAVLVLLRHRTTTNPAPRTTP